MSKAAALLLVLALLMVYFIPTPLPTRAAPRTIVVPDDYSTISMAVENAVSGDTIYVKAGYYTERIVIEKALSLKGEDKQTTIINGNSSGTVILVRHDNVEITGFSIIYDEIPNSLVPYWMWGTRLIGVHLLSVSNCSIHGNNISDCGAGIWFYDAHENSVSDNSIFRCNYGIRVEGSTGNSISDNSLTGNWGGLWLLSSANNKLRANVIAGNVRNFAVAGGETAAYINDVDTSNTVDAKPIYYWVDASGRTVPQDAGCVVLTNCENITVQGMKLSKVQDGILLAHCWNSIVTGNTISDCTSGVTLFNSTYDKIFENNIDGSIGVNAVGNGTRIYNNVINAGGTGIFIEGNYHTVTRNTVNTGTVGAGDRIIECKGSYNNISQNTLNGQTYVGLLLEGSHNMLFDNTVTYGGVRVEGSSNLIAKNKITYETISVSGGPENVICGNTILNGYDLGVTGEGDTYYANHVETNGLGARISGTEVLVHDNVLYHNNFIISSRTGPVWGENHANSWDNGSEGNYWSDYNGTDANHDEKGDTPYLIMSKTLDVSLGGVVDVVIGQDNYPLMAPFDISTAKIELPDWQTPQWENEETPTPTTNPSPSPAPPMQPNTTPTSTPSMEPTPTSLIPKPFPTTLVTASLSIGTIVVIGLLVYFKKRR